ncbi:Nuclear autoantigenic sperm protein [Fukomys damarensis]|uniref:Nuclear autoantigenic sperm protein n=1 Tax=Fukomys damarensis TaxID=885580 RepID=A0A091D9K4_FUKDA|nr:Nuclear autoantigenic sperm protein [Fukomys damarensis]
MMATEPIATAAIAMELVSTNKIEDAPAPSTSSDKVESLDVDNETKKLLGLGKKYLVIGDIPAAVDAFQEAASLSQKEQQDQKDWMKLRSLPGKPEQKAPGTEEGKSIFGTDIQKEECREKGQEDLSIKEKPKEDSIVTLEKQGTAAEVEAEPVDLTVKPVDVGGDEPEGQVVASENEQEKACTSNC